MTRAELDAYTTGELLQLVKFTDDRAILWCPRQRTIWAEIARRGGIKT
jgi:hypothetical protein